LKAIYHSQPNWRVWLTYFTGSKSCICWWGITEEKGSINCWLLSGFGLKRIDYKRISNKGINNNSGLIPS